jgi:branched-subunit amino acid ABC-type transport system permease component
MLLASLGMYVVLQNTIAMVFGSDTKTIRQGDIQEGLNVLGAKITQLQVLTICISMTLLMVLAIALKRTKVGVAIRTLASDPELARTVGIDPDRVMFWVFFIASSLGGIAGILVALDVDMTPTMGMTAMLMGVVAVIIGGVRSPLGVLLGALLLGMAQHLGVWKVGAQWQDAIAFAILLIFLLIRPRGIFGRKLRRSEV